MEGVFIEKQTRLGSMEMEEKLDSVAPCINLAPCEVVGVEVGGRKEVTSATGCADSRMRDLIWSDSDGPCCCGCDALLAWDRGRGEEVNLRWVSLAGRKERLGRGREKASSVTLEEVAFALAASAAAAGKRVIDLICSNLAMI